MIRRICPVCDQVMSFPHYCTVCRSFVKKPWIRDVDYYLNESHPADETNCSYHHMPPGGREAENPWQGAFEALGHSTHTEDNAPRRLRAGRVSTVPGTSETVPVQSTARRTAASAIPNVPRGKQQKKEKRGTGKIVLFVAILYILVQLFIAFSNVLFPLILDASAQTGTVIWQAGGPEDDFAFPYEDEDVHHV